MFGVVELGNAWDNCTSEFYGIGVHIVCRKWPMSANLYDSAQTNREILVGLPGDYLVG